MSRPSAPSDTQRLLRAFKVPPTAKKGSIIIGSGFALLAGIGAPFAFLPAAAIAGSLGFYELMDRRAIRNGLRELERWGIPVEGYREWLLAEHPTFDVELRRTVDVGVVVTSARAIDTAIQVRRLGDREVRFITRRIALPGIKDGEQPTYLGDRRLLEELYQRILSPLHADVGIARIRMGELSTLEQPRPSQLAAGDDAGAPAVEGMGAFRDQAMAAPPALQALVHAGTMALAQDAKSLRYRNERALHATGRTPQGFGTVLAITLGAAASGAQIGLVGVGIGAVAGFCVGLGVVIANNTRNARSADSMLANTFPIEDYDAWLVSGRPLFDIELAGPVDMAWLGDRLRSIEAYSEERAEAVKWVEDIQWIDETIVRVETRPTLIATNTGRLGSFYGGSHILFQRLVTEVLQPLHRSTGIVAVRMGGYINRRV